MPSRAPLPCAQPGCPSPQPCPAHPARRWGDGAHGRRMPAGWDATRARILTRDHHRCAHCGAAAAEVDHITRGIDADWNLQSLCTRCHRAKTQAEAALAARTAAVAAAAGGAAASRLLAP